MIKKSSSADKTDHNDLVDQYLNKARKSPPIVDKAFISETIRKQHYREATQKKKGGLISRLILPSPSARAMSLVSVALVVILLAIFVIPREPKDIIKESVSKDSSLPNDTEWTIEQASLAKDYFLDKMSRPAKDTIPPQVGILFKEKSNSPNLNIEHVPILKATKPVLEAMGFVFTSSEIMYEGNVKEGGHFSFTVKTDQNHSVSLMDKRVEGARNIIYPRYVSRMDGKQTVRFWKSFESQEKVTSKSAYFERVLDNLVPIAIPHPNNENDHLAIFWFESSKELFDALVEESIPDTALQSKVPAENSGTNNAETTSLTIKQNPFYSQLEVNYFLKEAGNVQIDLVTVDGALLKTLLPRSYKESSAYNINFPLDDIQSGIYILVMTTDTHRISKRIIKQ